GRLLVDFLLPDLGIAIEVDGAYWHPDPVKDARKTAALQRAGLAVVRFGETELNETPNVYGLVIGRLQRIAWGQRGELLPPNAPHPDTMIGCGNDDPVRARLKSDKGTVVRTRHSSEQLSLTAA